MRERPSYTPVSAVLYIGESVRRKTHDQDFHWDRSVACSAVNVGLAIKSTDQVE